MVDVLRVRELRQKIRDIIDFAPGRPITDEQLSAAVAMLSEVWAMRIYCSPEKHTSLEPAELMQRIANDVSVVLIDQAKEMLPHATTFSFFRDGRKP